MLIWGYGCGMVDCSVCAGVGDDAGDQRYHRELAANRSGSSKTCRPGASECSIEHDLIDLMKAFSLLSAEGIGRAWGAPLRPPTPFDERFGQWETRLWPQ